ncbi:unnamed protein product [Miscanthus lutarioriparius]|uniref:Phosphoinositide phospholipase C n=1 Tax=Miscanthus lutarioriparius TaxID=422564 RepID=A0A811SRW0_9POAL|nr:unnamed protein product [Miscanthus lutarioriparius]
MYCCFPCRFHSWDEPSSPAAPKWSPPEGDVRAIFSLHKFRSDDKDVLDEDGLRRCLGAYQQGGKRGLDDDDTNDVERLLEQIRSTRDGPRILRQQLFTFDDFHRILFSHDVNPPIRHRRVHHDMTLPLSHYFIYSVHNPYYATAADQWLCSSHGRSDEPIIRALKMGVRAIEVAMWPNSKADDIKIHHGWTQNTRVLLTECLKSIKEYAFIASRYPVIITLEDNLQSSNLQKKAAKVFLDVLGDVLYWPHADYIDVRGNAYSNNKPLKDFPSPDELMGAVLLSTKPPSHLEVDVSEDDDDQLHVHKGADDKDAAWGPEVPFFQTEKIQSDHQKVHTEKLTVDIPKCLHQGLPKATRVTSSNYNPFLGWVHGAQMVALDMQEYGRALWLMHGFYRANGGCGYVRKPDFLIMQTEPEVFDPRKHLPVKKTLKVKVYMGDGWLTDFKHAHTSFIPDLSTSVGIAGVPADTTAMKNTKATENTWVPVHQYDVSEKDVFGGQTVLPVSELRPGIRAVALFDRQGNRFDNVRLLMGFDFV